jgi:protein TonB
MVKNDTYFYLSGLLSFSLFLFFLLLFFIMMFSPNKISNFALQKENFISVSLELVPIPTKAPINEVVTPKNEPVVVEKPKEVDIGSLFSEVWTKDISAKKVEVKKVDTKRLELISKKIQTTTKNQSQPIEQQVNNAEAIKVDSQSQKSSSAEEVNQYLAKIQAIVYKYFIPPANSEGNTVKAVIELSAIGKVLDFRILTYSSNQALNQECDKIAARLVNVLFPENPDGVSTKTIVNITSDKN